MNEKQKKWLDEVEIPVTRDDKYFFQIIKRMDKLISLLEPNTRNIPKPIGTHDEPNEDCRVEYISKEKANEIVEDEEVNYEDMTLKELKSECKETGLTGYSRKSKGELIEMLKQ